MDTEKGYRHELEEETRMRTLIAFYSLEGNTAF